MIPFVDCDSPNLLENLSSSSTFTSFSVKASAIAFFKENEKEEEEVNSKRREVANKKVVKSVV